MRVRLTLLDLPAEQRAAVHNVIRKQGADKLLGIDPPTTLCPWVGLTFEHIYIGVEPDGYAHS